MFLTFTPNPCLERTARLDALLPGAAHRLDSARISHSAGGKGLNAARVAARFGATVRALAPVGRRQMALWRELTAREAVPGQWIETEGDTRQALNLVQSAGICTEFIENGAPLAVQDGTRLLEAWREGLREARLCAIGGAYAPGGAPGFEWHSALLCGLAASAGVPCLYDGRGPSFERALQSKTPPWAIKPNLEEASQILGRAIAGEAEELRAVRELGRRAELVLLSCAERGLYVGYRGAIEWFAAPRVDAVSHVGAGDALVGAFAARWLESGDIWEAARWGVAAGSACAAQFEPAFVAPDDAALLLPQVKRSTRQIALQIGP